MLDTFKTQTDSQCSASGRLSINDFQSLHNANLHAVSLLHTMRRDGGRVNVRVTRVLTLYLWARRSFYSVFSGVFSLHLLTDVSS